MIRVIVVEVAMRSRLSVGQEFARIREARRARRRIDHASSVAEEARAAAVRPDKIPPLGDVGWWDAKVDGLLTEPATWAGLCRWASARRWPHLLLLNAVAYLDMRGLVHLVDGRWARR